jgi:N-acetylglucosamine malate deacetylase 1
MNILALGAHPDDVEFLCAGTLLQYKAQGHKIFIALTTSGNQGSNEHSDREQIATTRETE